MRGEGEGKAGLSELRAGYRAAKDQTKRRLDSEQRVLECERKNRWGADRRGRDREDGDLSAGALDDDANRSRALEAVAHSIGGERTIEVSGRSSEPYEGFCSWGGDEGDEESGGRGEVDGGVALGGRLLWPECVSGEDGARACAAGDDDDLRWIDEYLPANDGHDGWVQKPFCAGSRAKAHEQ